MENAISINECKKEKEFFFLCLRRIILAICVMLLFFLLDKREEENKNEVINSFKDGKEVICKSSIVSIENGYKFEENKEFYVSNGINIFNLKRCNLK
jgi:hypothetical protein